MQSEEARDVQSSPPETDEAPVSGVEARPEEADRDAKAAAAGDASGEETTEQQVLEALKSVYDPELGINIVDLGLVYEVDVDEGKVHVEYTLTTMGCPIGPLIEQQMNQFAAAVPGVEEFTAEMVLRPPWSPEMMSDEAKAALGVF
ncbi:MAG: metal-sulfur cluster assembly factor [Actinomycetota bacterium]